VAESFEAANHNPIAAFNNDKSKDVANLTRKNDYEVLWSRTHLERNRNKKNN